MALLAHMTFNECGMSGGTMIEQKPLSLATRIAYFASSLMFAILITIALSVVYLAALSNPAVSRIDVGGFMVGMLFVCTLLIAACWLAYLPLRRHRGLIRIVTTAFCLLIAISVVLIVFIDWG